MSKRRAKRSNLRYLAEDVLDVARAHPCYSQASAVINNCCDHLRAMARAHEANAEALAADDKLAKVAAELARLKK